MGGILFIIIVIIVAIIVILYVRKVQRKKVQFFEGNTTDIVKCIHSPLYDVTTYCIVTCIIQYSQEFNSWYSSKLKVTSHLFTLLLRVSGYTQLHKEWI